MRLFLFFTALMVLCNCNRNKKTREETKKAIPTRGELSRDSQIFLGNRLFSEKTCITCHDVNKNKIGPSVKEIMKTYKEKNGNIVAFLEGRTEPIVDTTASQVAIMRANIEGFLKDLSNEELETIATYMMHVDELNME